MQIVEKWLTEGFSDLTYASLELKKYYKHLNRLTIDEGIIYRQFFDNTGQISHLQYRLPTHLRREALYRLHNSKTAGDLGITRTVSEFRRRFYFPGPTEALTHMIKNCMTCLQLKPVKNRQLKVPLEPIASEQSLPGDMLQIDLIGMLRSPTYNYALTGIDAFSKFLFAVPLTKPSASAVASALVWIFFRHCYIPKKILCDLGTAFTSDLFAELAKLLEVRIQHASLKHAQTIDIVERSHSCLKRILKLNTTEEWSDWYKYTELACFIHNTSYHSAINCTPSSLLHGREPLKPLDLRFSSNAISRLDITSDFVSYTSSAK